jgi:hypothetical protein
MFPFGILERGGGYWLSYFFSCFLLLIVVLLTSFVLVFLSNPIRLSHHFSLATFMGSSRVAVTFFSAISLKLVTWIRISLCRCRKQELGLYLGNVLLW